MAGEQREYAVAGRPDVRIHVRDLGLACCAVEFAAAIGRGLLVPAEAGSPGSAAVLVVSGTVTDALAPLDLRHLCQSEGHIVLDEAVNEKGARRLLIRRGPP
jgi:hypothetical protein